MADKWQRLDSQREVGTQENREHNEVHAACNFQDDDYDVTTATTDEEIKALGKAVFTKYDEQNGIHFYRKPKRFVSLA